ncbi:T9SS type A sorting domain-containing protein [candidate division KSB1 bacterium]|nr:T9SS type A sorting domain-containing protein [candidate division KSB1 bacterium]
MTIIRNRPRAYRLNRRIDRYTSLCVLAITLFSLRNPLLAADIDQWYPTTVAQIDSLYRTHYDPVVSPGKGTGWKPFNRFSNFYGQRAYPFGEIPAGARYMAWEEKISRERHQNLDENWVQIGPTNLAGRCLSIAWHPTNTNIIYVGSASGGVWKTTDGGANWTPLTDGLPSLAVSSVVLDPTNPNIIYIGTGEGSWNIDAVLGAGVFKSTDAGASWSVTGLSWSVSQGGAINKLVIDPDNPQNLWAASSRMVSGGGVYRTVNGGTSWTRYHAGDVKDVVIHPDSSNVLYCAVGYPWGHSENGIFRSVDSGVTWTRLSSGLPSASSTGRLQLSISPTSPQTIYAGISTTISANSQLLGIYKTSNAGASWTLQATTPNMYNNQGWYNNVCAVNPTNAAILYSSGLDCYRSSDSGVSWTRKSVWSYSPGHTQYAHADHHDLAFMPGNPTTIIVATDGGLYKSTNSGDTWTGLNNGLATYQFYAMDNDALQPNVAFGGTQDNGTNKYNNSSTWTAVLGGDGGYCNVDFTNSNIVYAETQRGSHYKSTNGGSSYSYIGSTISGAGAWVTPVEMDPTNSSVLLTATTRLWRTANAGGSWAIFSPDTSSQYISSIAIAPSNPNYIYYSYEYNGQVWRTANNGGSWTNVSSGLPNRYVTRVKVHPSDHTNVWVTVSGYGTGHVWKSTTGGGGWVNMSTGLPDIPCNDVVFDLNNPATMYVATDLGVYVSTNSGASWSAYSTGLPNVVVDDIALHPTSGILRASTHGRGMWETPTSAPTVTVLTPNGAENWPVGGAQTITWGTGGLGGNVLIELNRSYPGGSWETIAATTANDGSYSWTVAGATSSTARVRITSIEQPAVSDVSNANFSITQPSITLVAPNGGEVWLLGTVNTVSWSAVGATGPYVLEINRTYPFGSWEGLTIVASGSSYAWTVSGALTPWARIRVSLQSNPSVADTSNANFQIVQPTITLAYPNGGETWTPGETVVMRWSAAYLTSPVRVELNRSYPAGSWSVLAASTTADSLVWIVDQQGTTTARVRVVTTGSSAVADTSAANFTILTPTLSMISPNGGEVWDVGTNHTIRWSKANVSGPVNIQVNRNYPAGSWEPLAINLTADTVVWAVNAPYSNSARMRVQPVNIPGYNDDSNANFVIGTELELTAPLGGEAWNAGTSYAISWNRYNAAGNVTVEVNRSYPGGGWESLTTTAAGSSYAWTVTGPPSTTARVRVYLTANSAIGDTSSANFAINATGIALDYPVGGENWLVGGSQTILWTRTNAAGNATVQINRSYPSASWTNLTTTAAGNSYAWTVSSPTSSTTRIRVFLTSNSSIGDTCNSDLSITSPTLTLTTPNGGENWNVGSMQVVRWTRSQAAGAVTVRLNRTYPGGSWTTLTSTATADTFAWTVTSPTSTTARIRIYLNSNTAAADTSAANFTIGSSSIAVTAPNGGESWVLGLPYSIAFTRTNATGAATVELNRNYPAGAWEMIDNAYTGSSLSWTASGAASTTARMRVSLNSDPSVRDSSNANFSLVTPALTVSSPNGGDTLRIGAVATLSWTRANVTGAVTVALNRSYPGGSWETLSTTQSGSSMSWTVTGPVTDQARLRVSWNSLPSVSDESNADFHIVAGSLALAAPDGGESYTLGGPVTVRWTRVGATGNCTVQLNRNYPAGSWETLSTTVSADSLVWTSSGAASALCRVRVRLTADSTISDMSAGNFSLVQRSLVINSPVGGENWYVGSLQTISFTRTNATGNVTVQLNRAYPGASWETLATNVAGNSATWTVAGAASASARIRIYLAAETYVGDTINSNLSISSPGLIVTAPNGGEIWQTGTSYSITWQTNGFTDNARVELNRSYPGGAWETLASSVAGTTFPWTATAPISSTARVRVVAVNNSSLRDSSNANFQIVTPQLTLSAPNGGESLNLGFATTIRWTRSYAAGTVQVQLKRNYPSGSWEDLATSTADTLLWTPTGGASSAARVRVYLVSNASIGDTSATNFTLFQPVLALTSPNGGESWLRNSVHNITWTRSGLSGGVRVDFNASYPAGFWTTLASGQSGDSYAWTLTQNATATARVRVVFEANTAFADTSASNFSIVAPSLTVTAPNGNEQYNIGTSYSVTLSRNDHPGGVTVQLNRQYPSAAWETIATGVTANTLIWPATGPATLAARVRVMSEVYTSPLVGDTSDANFRILAPGVTLLSPDGGEVLSVGNPSWLRWVRVGVGNVDVLLNRNYPGGTWETLLNNSNSDSLLWTVTGPGTGNARVKVWATTDHNVSDQSASAFSIIDPQISLIEPSVGDTLAIGVANLIAWTRSAVSGDVRVDLNRTYPSASWTQLGVSSGDEIYWTGTGPTTGNARIRVVSQTMSWVGDTINANIAILTRTLNITEPVGSVDVAVGEPLAIHWSRSNLGPGANVYLSRQNPASSWELLASNVSADQYTWTATGPRATAASVRVLSTQSAAIGDTSTAFVILEPELALNSLNGGTVGAGNIEVISWTRSDASGPVDIHVNYHYPLGAWTVIASGQGGSSVDWTVPDSLTSTARIRIELTGTEVLDESSADFAIVTPQLTLLNPNGGELYDPDDIVQINWSRTATTGAAMLELNTNYPAGGWETLATGLSGNNWSWQVPNADFSHGRIRVSLVSRPEVYDISNADFGTQLPSLYLIWPNGGDSLITGTSRVIHWGRTNAPGTARLELNRNHPAGAWEQIGSPTSADSLAWTVNTPVSSAARFRVSLVFDPSVQDESDENFSILQPRVTLQAPLAGDSIGLGDTLRFAWQRIGVAANINVSVKRNWPSGSWETIGTNISPDSWSWVAAGTAAENARFRIALATNSTISDTTDGAVRIGAQQFVFVEPVAADTLRQGDTLTIRWERRFARGNVRVAISRNGTGGPWEDLGVTSGNQLAWPVAGPTSNITRFRLTRDDMTWVSAMTPFSLTIVEPSLVLTLPNPWQRLAIGRPVVIAWTRHYVDEPVDVMINRGDAGATVEVLRENVAGDSIHWTVTGPLTRYASFMLSTSSGVSVSEISEGGFDIGEAELSFVTPIGGETYIAGQPMNVCWNREYQDDPVRVELNRDYPLGEWVTLSDGETDTLFTWNVQGPHTEHARFRVVSTVDPVLGDTTGDAITLAVQSLTISEPEAGERVPVGFARTVHWTRTAVSDPVFLYLSRNGGDSFELLATNVSGDSYDWTPTEPASPNCLLRVVSSANPAISGNSPPFVTATPTLSVLSPNGGEELALGSSIWIRFNESDHLAAVDVQLNRNYPGGGWETLAEDLTVDSLLWTISGAASTTARIRVTSAVSSTWTDVSDANFTIVQPSLQITNPVSGTDLIAGDPLSVAWSRAGTPAPVRVWLRYAEGGADTLGEHVTESQLNAIVPDVEHASCYLVIRTESGTILSDSVALFGPYVPACEITQPMAGARWVSDVDQVVRWNRYHADGDMSVQLQRNWPSGEWETLATTAADSIVVTPGAWGLSRIRVTLTSRPLVTDEVTINVVSPTLELLPLASTHLRLGSEVLLAWQSTDLIVPVNLELNRDYPDGTWESLYSGPGSEYHWTVNGEPVQHARLRVTAFDQREVADTLEQELEFYRPSVSLELELTGDSVRVGDTLDLVLAFSGEEHLADISLQREPDGPWEGVLSGVAGGVYRWIVTGPAAPAARFLAVATDEPSLADTTRGFTILPPRPIVSFTWPVEFGVDTVGTQRTLTWSWTNGASALRIERQSGAAEWTTLADSISDSAWTWDVSASAADSVRFRLTAVDDPAVSVVSIARWVVVPEVDLLVESGSPWYVGEQHWIRWTRSDYAGPLTLELSRVDRAEPWLELATLDVDSFLWTVTGPASELAALRLRDPEFPSLEDTTDVPIQIREPRVLVVAPNGGEPLDQNQEIRLRWIGEGFGGGVAIALWRGDPVFRLDTLFLDTENDSSEIWTVSGPAATGCRLVVLAASDLALHDTSDADFTILALAAGSGGVAVPQAYALHAAYPNPFNLQTTLRYDLPRAAEVSIVVYDMLGREVQRLVEGTEEAGSRRVTWDASGLSSGIYFVRMSTEEFVEARKIHLIK